MLGRYFAGNRALTERLDARIRENRLSHCFVLEGPEGSGRKTLARLLVMAAMCRCEDPARIPCGECVACRKVRRGIHPDFAEVHGTGASGLFAVDRIREIRRDMFTVPSEGRRKAVLFCDADTMNEQSQNALLKILEEPPSYALFLITCKSASSLLPTVRSRAVILTLNPVSDDEARAFLESEGVPPAKIPELLRAGQGLIGKMKAALASDGLSAGADFAEKLALRLTAGDETQTAETCAVFEKDKPLARETVRALRDLFAEALRLSQNAASTRFSEAAAVLAEELSSERLLALTELCADAERALDRNVNALLFSVWFPAALRKAAGK